MTSDTKTPQGVVPAARQGRSRRAPAYQSARRRCSSAGGTEATARAGSAVTAATPGSDVALEDAGLGQAGEALAHGTGPALTDALDGHEVVEVGGQELLEVVEVVDQAVDDGAGQPGDLRQQAIAAGADRRVEGVADDGEAEGLGARGEVEQLGGGEVHQPGEHLLDGVGAARRLEVVADHQLTVVAEAAGQLLQLQGEQPAVRAEPDDVVVDLVADPADHLQALQ